MSIFAREGFTRNDDAAAYSAVVRHTADEGWKLHLAHRRAITKRT